MPTQLPLFSPASDWTPPQGELPALCGREIGLDTETWDEGLDKERGAGWVYRAGHLAGVSVAWDGGEIYVPVRHPETECRPLDLVIAWVDELMRRNHVCFFNAGYDLGWLRASGSRVWPERMDDASVQNALIDEEWKTNGLDAVATRLGIQGKNTRLLDEAAAAYGFQKRNGSLGHCIGLLPARYVGPYAEQDARATLQCVRLQRPEMEQQGLTTATRIAPSPYQTEIDLIRVVYEMRLRGIRVSTSKIEQARASVRKLRDETLRQIETPWRRSPAMQDLRSPGKLGELFRSVGIYCPQTPKTGQPSVTKQWLEELDHPLGAQVRKARQLDELDNKFLGTYIQDFEHRGRLHAEIHPLKTDRGGTVTTRIAYSNPPLQQMPARASTEEDEKIIALVRGCFLPERDSMWGAFDFSQQEPRIAVDRAFVCGVHGAAEAVAYYRDKGAEADFHTMVAEMTGIPRKPAKIINLGLMYGMGLPKLARSLGIEDEEAIALIEQYHGRMPWVRGLSRLCENHAKMHGSIRLIDGARRHFPFWQPRGDRSGVSYAREAQAREKWGDNIERAFCRNAMNSVVQGSAARQTKRAMVESYRLGHLPMVQMHDELGFSVASYAECEMLEELMINVVPLSVPMRVDAEIGATWGEAKTDYRQVFPLTA